MFSILVRPQTATPKITKKYHISIVMSFFSVESYPITIKSKGKGLKHNMLYMIEAKHRKVNYKKARGYNFLHEASIQGSSDAVETSNGITGVW